MQLEHYWNELADIKDELAARDWFMGTSGNLAIRVSNEPTQFYVTASGKDKRKRTEEDFLLVDADGVPVTETHLMPSAETLLHSVIYANSDAQCSLHVHTLANNVISHIFNEQQAFRIKGQELIKAFDLWNEDDELIIPIIANHADIPTLAKALEPYVHQDFGAVLIHNHGITVWGKNGFQAKKLLEASEFLFQYELEIQKLKMKVGI